MFSALSKRLRAYAEKDGRGYPDWAVRYLPVLRRFRRKDYFKGRILEIGANAHGFARFTERQVIAVDVDLGALHAARSNHNVLPVLADAAALPFRDQSMGLCVCMDSFEHLPPEMRASAAAEIMRVISLPGAAAVGFPAGEAAAEAESRIRESYQAHCCGKIHWLEEHREQGLPDADAIHDLFHDFAHGAYRVTRSGNASIRWWEWMWRVLMCNWPGRGNSLFQVLLRWMTPLLSRQHKEPCYRALLWIEPMAGIAIDTEQEPEAETAVEKTPARLTVIIPTWNRRDLAVACLQSLEQQSFRDFEVMVVDDGSTDDTQEVIRRDFPGVTILSQGQNRGFAVAVNAGLRRAESEWIFLLNNDVTLDPACLEHLLETAEQYDATMAAPLLLWQDDPDVVYAAGDRIRANGRPESIGFRQPRGVFQMPDNVFGVSAAAGLYHRTVFERVGLLDERFVAYFEDSDLCFRARLAGFTAVFAPTARANHIGSASISGKTWWRSAQCFRNHALLVIKNMPALLLLRFGPRIARERLHQAHMLFSSARTEFGALGAAMVFVKTLASLVYALPHAFRARRRIQRARRITCRELWYLLTRD